MSFITFHFRKIKLYAYARACTSTQVVVLLAIVVLAMLKQLHFQNSLVLTSLYLIFAACMFMFRAYRDEELKWIHIGMFIFALCLPYMGCVDLKNGTLEGNTLVFGLATLSILWLLAVRFVPFHLLKEARSTVLWFYGTLALVVMFIRLFFERHVPVDPEWYKGFMDYTGPLLMTAVLVVASYYSRSIIPSLMASLIAVILFPELKANFRATFDSLGFGSGLGSACSALGMIGISFVLRKQEKLKSLSEGDKFMMSSYFPLRRYDYTLFTLPLIASAAFLLIKTASFNLIRQEMSTGGVQMKGAIALLVCSLSAFSLYLYLREKKLTWLFHLGWIYLGLGLCFVFDLSRDVFHWTEPALYTLLILQAYYLIAYGLSLRYPYLNKLFVEKFQLTLSGLSHVSSALLIINYLGFGELRLSNYLLVFTAGQFLWHLKAQGKTHYGFNLYLLTWAYASSFGNGSYEAYFIPGLYLSLASLGVHLIVSRLDGFYEECRAFFKSFLTMASLSSLVFFTASLPYVAQGTSLDSIFVILTSLLLFLAYVENQSKILLTFSGVSFYSYLNFDQIELILEPLRLSFGALFFALIAYAFIQLEKKHKTFLQTDKALDFFKSTSESYPYLAAILVTKLSIFLHLIYWRNESEQLVATYVSTATLCFIAWAWRKWEVSLLAIISLCLANIHLVRCFGKNYLSDRGLSEIHLLCLGIGLTLLITSLVRKYSPNSVLKSLLAHSGLVLSLLVLVFLVGNYMSHPNLNTVSPFRFFVSGAMAFLAALYFRSAARKPQDGEEKYVDIFEGVYHFGLSMSFWCLTLMIPFMRSPQTAILAFGLPAIYFYYMTEWYNSQGKAHHVYRNSSSLLILVLLILYVFKGFVHMTFYPEVQMDNTYYHSNAPTLIVYGLLLFRLHALGGRIHLPLYGGLALLLGVFFTLSAAPSFSPFENPIKASFLAVFNAHAWVLLNYEKSPLRSYFMRFSNLSEDDWQSLRKTWGAWLIILTQVMGFVALTDTWGQSHLFAPVLFLSATVVGHLSLRKKSKFYGLITLCEIVFAMHAGFLMESYINADDVIWLITALWGIFTFYSLYKFNNIPSKKCWPIALFFIALLIPHVIYHEVYSYTSLSVVVLIVALSLITAYPREYLKNPIEKIMAFTYLLVPAYLAYFKVYDERGGLFQKAALPAALFSLFLMAVFMPYLAKQKSDLIERLFGLRYKVLNLIYLVWKQNSSRISHIILWSLCLLTTALLLLFIGEAFTDQQFILLLCTYGGLVVLWFYKGKEKQSQLAYYMMAYSLLIFMAFLRHQMVMATNLWRDEYDIWSSLLVSLTIAGLKPFVDKNEDKMRNPLLGVLFLMPLLAIGKSFYYGLGTDYTLMIIGVNSLVFSFLGKEDRQSPYHLIAMIGYVAFTSMTLWNKLDLRTLHVYIIPSGVGVLIILQLMQNSISKERRNLIRLLTLVMMVSTSIYYAVIAEPRSIGFNLTVIILCLLAMAFGSLWKIRLYLILGFAGLLIDLLSIFTRLLIDLQRGSRMAILGSCILLIGGCLVFANIYYKTQQAKIKVIIEKWRLKLSTWE
ncbi:hypothetical protein LNTAR_17108 [Lentisphaera araneosa HTCC2155]|uniref:Uncharacterized protein n=1 Tax=Lentisphaera araneosa HTCC2155 TaxID=313628 RepID=A6DFB0_9BACT|nr:hypothetical protein [Lentisphaera araneosa]EDM29490.1 hypothetical protein LNTAR_17108 [Lentisphaera araneosa HTCC2155]